MHAERLYPRLQFQNIEEIATASAQRPGKARRLRVAPMAAACRWSGAHRPPTAIPGKFPQQP